MKKNKNHWIFKNKESADHPEVQYSIVIINFILVNHELFPDCYWGIP